MRESIKELLDEKIKDESYISNEVCKILNNYSNKWGGVEISLTTETPTQFKNDSGITITTQHSIEVKINI